MALQSTLSTGQVIDGAGVILSASGEVVTTYNVVNGAVSIAAELGGTGARFAATTFALSPSKGVAVLQLINAAGLGTANIGDSSGIKVGDRVTAIGAAQGGHAGIVEDEGAVVSVEQSTISSQPGGANPESLDGLIEFNSAVPGAGSGGPLLDASGRLVGLDTASDDARAPASSSSSGFAIPIDRVMTIVHDVNTNTKSPDILQGHGAYLGIEVLNSAVPPGALIIAVDPGTPAQVVGMAAEDVIVSVDGTGVGSVAALRDQLERHHGGDRVLVGWVDPAGRHHSATVQLAVATFT